MLLEVRGLTKRFGGLKAVSDFDIDVAEGEIVGSHRPERGRQVDRLQPHHRGPTGHERHGHVQ